MSLHLTPQEHDDDPPSGWTVRKSGRKWNLLSKSGGVLDTFNTKTEAERGKHAGFIFNLYQKEGRRFNGQPVPNWNPFVA